MNKKQFTYNREFSWLKFNDRVLSEASDDTVPLLDKLKFISIYCSNLDEFFMIRVGSLFDLMTAENNPIDDKSGLTVNEQLNTIYDQVLLLGEKRDLLYNSVRKELKERDIYDLSWKDLTSEEEKYLKTYYKDNIQPLLSPQIIDTHHPFPHLENKQIYIGMSLSRKSKNVFGMIPVPIALPPILFLQGANTRFIRTELIVEHFAEKVFDMYDCEEKVPFAITRNADISPENDIIGVDMDFRINVKKMLKKRQRLDVVRLELSCNISSKFEKYFCDRLKIEKYQIFTGSTPFKIPYAFSLEQVVYNAQKKGLVQEEFIPQKSPLVDPDMPLIQQVRKHDLLLSFPYESMDPFLRAMKEASVDEAVLSIKITLYRVAKKARLIEYLCAAAENGKDVTVLIELRARFDEQNNINWSERLEEAGCKIIYGFENYKVHSKICLITRKRNNAIETFTQVGTGNYNENTAALYTDLSLMTCNIEIGQDAIEFFKNMAIGNLKGFYNHLMVAPVSLRSGILNLIDREIEKRNEGYIRIKVNSITDMKIMNKLKEASCAGVRVELIVRGICCIIPGIKDVTENIFVCNVVGRFLEHSRVYCFGRGEDEKIFISSADFMTRNTARRVEVACPVFDGTAKKKIHHILDLAAQDNTKARLLKPNMNYSKKLVKNAPINSQAQLMAEALNSAPKEQASLFSESPVSKNENSYGSHKDKAKTARLKRFPLLNHLYQKIFRK